MTEDLNLPASLQRLEITHERPEVSKCEENNPFSVPGFSDSQPECFLENLSLKAICSKGNCLCNKKRDQEDNGDVLKKLKGIQRRPVLRKSRLNNVVLRVPFLKLNDVNHQGVTTGGASAGGSSGKESEERVLTRSFEDCTEISRQIAVRSSILRAPVLRVQGGVREVPLQILLPAAPGKDDSSGVTRNNASALCAVQARNPAPDDTNIEELASYFDLFVHIPKKMSEMAEMMYI